jgi:hypothetical protein
MANDELRPNAASAVRNYSELKAEKFSRTDKWKEYQKNFDRKVVINQRREALKDVPVAKESILSRCEVGYREELERAAQSLANHINHNLSRQNPLRGFSLSPGSRDFIFYPWELVEAAIEMLPEAENAISDDERQKEIEAINKELKKVEKKLNELREIYALYDPCLEHWANRQQWCKSGIDPLGYDIKGAPDYIQEAYTVAELSKIILPRAYKIPAPRPSA